MSRFIIVSFGVLFWAFYEMSGGSEFEPGWYIDKEDKLAIAKVEETTLPKVEPEQVVARAETRINDLNTEPQPAAKITPVTFTNTEDRVVDVLLTRAEAVETPADTAKPEEVAVAEPAEDLRTVSAARVNLRNGPGTKFSVLGKLTRGEEVQVLSDNGEGWIKLRVKSSNRVGWMADYLVTASN